jgi:hypothetical protein
MLMHITRSLLSAEFRHNIVIVMSDAVVHRVVNGVVPTYEFTAGVRIEEFSGLLVLSSFFAFFYLSQKRIFKLIFF